MQFSQDVVVQFGAQGAKRRRLRVKQDVPSLRPIPANPVAVLPSCTDLWKDVHEPKWENLEHRPKYKLVHNKFSWWFKGRPAWQSDEGSMCSKELWELAIADYGSLSRRQKNQVMRYFVECTGAPPWVLKFSVQMWPLDAADKGPKVLLRSLTALLTYQGEWGVMELDPNLPLDPTPEELSSFVERMQEAEDIWKALQDHSKGLAVKLHATHWACSLEICLKTFEEERVTRLHAHVFLKSDVQMMRCDNARVLNFLKTEPHLRETLWNKKFGKTNWAGAYYCLAPKLGSVFRDGSLQRFRDFPVDPSWVFNFIEAGKISYESARSELVQCGKGLTRRLADLDLWHASRQTMRVNEMVAAVQAASRKQLQEFPRWPIVDAWLAEVMKPLQTRKKCLVLHGPSRTGKTEFVRALFPLGAVWELNCANLRDICLNGFDCLQHRVILWDEAPASLVSSNRKVFQHPLCSIDLGHSPTGQHVKRFFLGHCCSIITTNKWHEDVMQLSDGDQEWLRMNTIVFNVEQPLWQVART